MLDGRPVNICRVRSGPTPHGRATPPPPRAITNPTSTATNICCCLLAYWDLEEHLLHNEGLDGAILPAIPPMTQGCVTLLQCCFVCRPVCLRRRVQDFLNCRVGVGKGADLLPPWQRGAPPAPFIPCQRAGGWGASRKAGLGDAPRARLDVHDIPSFVVCSAVSCVLPSPLRACRYTTCPSQHHRDPSATERQRLRLRCDVPTTICGNQLRRRLLLLLLRSTTIYHDQACAKDKGQRHCSRTETSTRYESHAYLSWEVGLELRLCGKFRSATTTISTSHPNP